MKQLRTQCTECAGPDRQSRRVGRFLNITKVKRFERSGKISKQKRVWVHGSSIPAVATRKYKISHKKEADLSDETNKLEKGGEQHLNNMLVHFPPMKKGSISSSGKDSWSFLCKC